MYSSKGTVAFKEALVNGPLSNFSMTLVAVAIVWLCAGCATALLSSRSIRKSWGACVLCTLGVVVLYANVMRERISYGDVWDYINAASNLASGEPLHLRLDGISALFLLLRASASLSLTLLLVLTTPWNTTLSALTVLRVPDVFILILGMTYRYIYLLLRIANDMFLSRKSRVVGRLDDAENRRMLAAVSGALLNKSLDMSSEVYLAMQSRGFRGAMVTLKPFKMQARDWFWLAAFAAISLSAVFLGR